ncbi:hypothetical protein ASPCAL05117 [Aspergillus calidoustus]|uniref:Aminoglycoside phosphotransferase domain-containing protein n=1 Tax=Aspergillus calidoustus TaxID=454130 RepID=A0A0U5G383_ASPCI|nr:hypothetical protein ASPCAL05117 [Aspergillus calidoustus]
MELVRARTDIRVPEIYGYETNDDNSVHAAFILMEFLPGSSAMDANGGYEVHQGQFPLEKRVVFFKEVANIQVQLCSVRLPKIGSVIRRDDDTFDVGPLPRLGGPFSTATEFYLAWAKHAKFPTSDSDIRKFMQCGPVDDILSSIHKFPDGLRDLASKISACDNGPFPLYHPDFYHSNIIVDESFAVLGVIDWEGACTVPWELVEPPLFLCTVPPAMDSPNNYNADGQHKDINVIHRFRERAQYVQFVQEMEEELGMDQSLSRVLMDPDIQGLAHAIKVYHDPGKLGFYCNILKPFKG